MVRWLSMAFVMTAFSCRTSSNDSNPKEVAGVEWTVRIDPNTLRVLCTDDPNTQGEIMTNQEYEDRVSNGTICNRLARLQCIGLGGGQDRYAPYKIDDGQPLGIFNRSSDLTATPYTDWATCENMVNSANDIFSCSPAGYGEPYAQIVEWHSNVALGQPVKTEWCLQISTAMKRINGLFCMPTRNRGEHFQLARAKIGILESLGPTSTAGDALAQMVEIPLNTCMELLDKSTRELACVPVLSSRFQIRNLVKRVDVGLADTKENCLRSLESQTNGVFCARTGTGNQFRPAFIISGLMPQGTGPMTFDDCLKSIKKTPATPTSPSLAPPSLRPETHTSRTPPRG